MLIVDDLRWSPKSDGARPRKEPIRQIVWHWTGGRDSARCVQTLLSRGLSIHYTIDHDGTIRRHAVPETVTTQHVSKIRDFSVNAQSIGIEIAHKGFPPSFGGVYARESYMANLRGKKVPMLRFADAQLKAARELGAHLSERYKIPLQLPTDASGQLIDRVMTLDEIKAFAGHAGHFHYEAGKSDPGWELLKFVAGLE